MLPAKVQGRGRFVTEKRHGLPKPGITPVPTPGRFTGVRGMRCPSPCYTVISRTEYFWRNVGKRLTAEDFPKTNWNLPKFLWMPSLRMFGFMGINFLNDILIYNGTGVGGGSLVYASTHIKPPKAFFTADEWAHMADWEAELTPYYDLANRMLGTAVNPKMGPADDILREIATEMGQEETFHPTPVGSV